MAERKAVTAATRSRYQRASKKEKGKILAEFIELTGYHRVYARSVLRTGGQKVVRKAATGPLFVSHQQASSEGGIWAFESGRAETTNRATTRAIITVDGC